MGTTSHCLHLNVNYCRREKKFLYVNYTTKQNNKTFLIEDFFHLQSVSTTPAVHLELQISHKFSKKIRNGSNRILRGSGGNWFMKKT